MKYYVEFIGVAATVKPVPADIYLRKLGLEPDDGYTWEQACERVSEHYDELARQWWNKRYSEEIEQPTEYLNDR